MSVGGGPGCACGFGGRGSYSMPLPELDPEPVLRCARRSRSSDIMPAKTVCRPGSIFGGASAVSKAGGGAFAGGSADTGCLPGGMALFLLAVGGAVLRWPSTRRQKASVPLRQVGRWSSACCAAPETHCSAMKTILCCCAEGSCKMLCRKSASVCDRIFCQASATALSAA